MIVSLELVALGHAVEEGGVAFQNDVRLRIEDVDLGEVVALADLEVVEIVRRGDLHRAGAGFRIGIAVGDDLQPAADQRQDGVLADDILVALVIGMDGNAGVAEHRLGARRGDDDEAIGLAFDRDT